MKQLLYLLAAAFLASCNGYTTQYSKTYTTAIGMTMSPAYDSLSLSGKGIRIGVLDAGFGGFRTDRWTRSLEVGACRDFTNTCGEDFFADEQDHGTRVCRNIGGISGDTLRGLAWGATYFLAKTDRAEVEPRSEERQFMEGVQWLLEQDVDIITSSLAYTTFDDFDGYTPRMLDGRSSTLSRFLDSLLQANPHLVFVQSAGNEGDGSWRYICFPGDVREVITVGSSDSNGTRFHSSGCGREDVDYIKPDFAVEASPLGTSFSTPVVTGLCAALLEYKRVDRAALLTALRASGSNAAAPDRRTGYGAPQTAYFLRSLTSEK